MVEPLIVIVTGPPCTGKTTLGKRLAADLRLPFLSKDTIKEVLFDTLGWSDRERSKQLGRASMELLFTWAEVELAAGRSFVIEANFHAALATPRFLDLRENYSFTPFVIECRTDGQVLAERYLQRANTLERHAGHVDNLAYEELAPSLLDGRYEPLAIGGSVLEVDTTDFAQVDYQAILAAVKRAGDE
jgi:predicted kinase